VTQVCVIEDDEAIRETMRLLLEDAGYSVIEASDGITGRDLLRESPNRMIAVVDHKLPRMDGCDLLEQVANDEDLRERHTYIFVTASPKRAAEDCEETLEELAVPVLAKPFDIDELLDAVAEAEQKLVHIP
jgi:CheY-like chemotaxis protein